MSDDEHFPFNNNPSPERIITTTKKSSNFTEQFNKINKFIDEKEFSQAIDNCSEILNSYLIRNG